MGKVEGKVALVTGIARGQGRSHALRLAAEGADIIGLDAARPIETVGYPLPNADDLGSVVAEIEALGRRVVAGPVDARDSDTLGELVDRGVSELGRLDIVVANAGIISPPKKSWEYTDEEWQVTIDVNLTGVWKTTRAAVPHILKGGNGGSIILTSSAGGHIGAPNVANYVAAKHGVIGLMRSLANELGAERVRVNAVCPTNVRTGMIDNEVSSRLFRPDLAEPTLDDAADVLARLHMIPVPWIDAEDISNAVLFLASDDGKFITGQSMMIDCGLQARYP